MQELRGGAQRCYLRVRPGETIESEGQRVSWWEGGGVTRASRPRSWKRVLGCVGCPEIGCCLSGSGTRGQKSFVSGSPCKGVLEFWIPGSILCGGHGCQFTGSPACPVEDKVVVVECWKRGVLEIICTFTFGYSLQLGLVTSYWVEFGKGFVEEARYTLSIDKNDGNKEGIIRNQQN